MRAGSRVTGGLEANEALDVEPFSGGKETVMRTRYRIGIAALEQKHGEIGRKRLKFLNSDRPVALTSRQQLSLWA